MNKLATVFQKDGKWHIFQTHRAMKRAKYVVERERAASKGHLLGIATLRLDENGAVEGIAKIIQQPPSEKDIVRAKNGASGGGVPAVVTTPNGKIAGKMKLISGSLGQAAAASNGVQKTQFHLLAGRLESLAKQLRDLGELEYSLRRELDAVSGEIAEALKKQAGAR